MTFQELVLSFLYVKAAIFVNLKYWISIVGQVALMSNELLFQNRLSSLFK